VTILSKKNLVFLLACLGFWVIPLRNYGQFAKDSLEKALPLVPARERVRLLSELANVISFNDLPSGLRKNEEAIQLANRLRDVDGQSFAWSQEMVLAVRNGDEAAAIKAVDSALFYAQKSTEPLIKGIAWYRKGYLENLQNKPEEAIKSWHKALPYLAMLKGARYESGIYYLLYGIYAERKDSRRASVYAHAALRSAVQSRSAELETAAWQINGTFYLDSFRQSGDSAMLDSAVMAYHQAISIFQSHQDQVNNKSVIALPALNLADIYMDYYPPWYQDSALANINLALRASVAPNNTAMQANCYDIISKLNRKRSNYSGAEEALLKEKTIVDAIEPPNYYLSMNLYQSLAEVKELQGASKAALQFYKQYLSFYQKEFDARQFQTIQQLEAKYQNEKKDKKLKLLLQRNAFQKRQNYLYTGIAAIAVLGLLFLFVAYHFRLKYALQREKLKDEEAARLLAEQRLMQQHKAQLQKELLAGALQVEHKNEMLQNLKDKLLEQGGSSPNQLEKIINEELRMDEDFGNIRSEFKDIHPEFFNRLQQNAGQKLTQLDLRYCAYFYMKLSTKQIANLMNVAPKSVRMTRYRLKQKLGLGKDEDLASFLSAQS